MSLDSMFFQTPKNRMNETEWVMYQVTEFRNCYVIHDFILNHPDVDTFSEYIQIDKAMLTELISHAKDSLIDTLIGAEQDEDYQIDVEDIQALENLYSYIDRKHNLIYHYWY